MWQFREPVVALVMLSAAFLLLLPTAFSFLPVPGQFGWGCPPCNQSACPSVPCDESLQYIDGCGCCIQCAKLEGERCGGDGDIGGRCNSSGLQCVYRLGSIFGEWRVGLCENERCQRRSCDYRQRCKVVVNDDGSVRKLCDCDYFRCEHKLNPLCGRDGKNYTSVCELQKTECLLGQPIGIKHFNECIVETYYISPRKNNTVLSPPDPAPTQCIYRDVMYDLHDIEPPTTHNPCTYHVCSEYGQMLPYPVPGCEDNPPEIDWQVEEPVYPAEWTQWSKFSKCLGDCVNAGLKKQTRTCTNPPPSTHPEAAASALQCEGPAVFSRLCQPKGCDICQYTDWTAWSVCSTSELCSKGIRTRSRLLTNVPTVPELCFTEQIRDCQLLECTTCNRHLSDSFQIYNTETGCTSLDHHIDADMCGGSCGEGMCCHSMFRRYPIQPPIVFEFLCGSHIPYLRMFQAPFKCVCTDCNEAQVLPFMLPPWEIIY